MTKEQIKKEAEWFFEWPNDKREMVTYTSCLLFAEHVAQRASKELDPVSVEDIGVIKMMIREQIGTRFGVVSGQGVDDAYNVLMPVIRAIIKAERP